MGSKTGVERFSISAPPDLVKEFDSAIRSLNQDRSKAIQQSMRLFLSEHNWTRGGGECAGAIVLVYDHSVHEVGEELTDIQHESRAVINSVLHIHVDDKNCLEIIAVRGGVDGLKALIDQLTACRGVKVLKHTIIGI